MALRLLKEISLETEEPLINMPAKENIEMWREEGPKYPKGGAFESMREGLKKIGAVEEEGFIEEEEQDLRLLEEEPAEPKTLMKKAENWLKEPVRSIWGVGDFVTYEELGFVPPGKKPTDPYVDPNTGMGERKPYYEPRGAMLARTGVGLMMLHKILQQGIKGFKQWRAMKEMDKIIRKADKMALRAYGEIYPGRRGEIEIVRGEALRPLQEKAFSYLMKEKAAQQTYNVFMGMSVPKFSSAEIELAKKGIVPQPTLNRVAEALGKDITAITIKEASEYILKSIPKEIAKPPEIKPKYAGLPPRKAFYAGKREATEILRQEYKAKRTDLLTKLRQRQEDMQSVKQEVVDYAKTHLPISVRGHMLNTVKNARTQTDLAKAFTRIDQLADRNMRKTYVTSIKKRIQNVIDSPSVAVDYKQKIKAIKDQIEFTAHRKETLDRLNKTMKYIADRELKGEITEIPKRLAKSLLILARQPANKIPTSQLEALENEIKLLERLGRTKLKTRLALYEYEKRHIKDDLLANTVNLDRYTIKRPPIGAKLTPLEKLNNAVNRALMAAQRIDLVISPQDVVFDLLDGGKGTYAGSNYTNIKKKTDLNFTRYLMRKDSLQDPLRKLRNDLKLDNSNMDRIGAYAALQQEGGLEKLLNTGYTQEEIDAIKLTDNEMKWYLEARKRLDALRPEIAEVMRTVYNQEMGEVKNYFSFMTDWQAMDNAEVYQRIGDRVEEYGRPTKTPEMGFTKTRTLGEQKIKINAFDIYMKHTDNASYLIEMARDNKMLFEIANSPQYKEAAGALGQEMTLEYLDLISRKGGTYGQKRIEILDTLRRNVGIGIMGFKITSTLVQLTPIIDGAAFIGDWSFKGCHNIATSQDWRYFVAKFPEIKARIGDDPAFLETTMFESWRAKGLKPLIVLDRIAAMSVASGAYEKKMMELGLPVDFNNINQEALQYAQRIVRRSQSTSIFKDTPLAISKGALTGNKSIDRALLHFQNFMLNRWSVIRHDIWRSGIRERDYKKASAMFAWLALSVLTGSGIRYGYNQVKNWLLDREQREDRGYWDIVGQETTQNIPFASAIVSVGAYGSSPIPALRAITEGIKGIYGITKGKKMPTKLRGAVRLLEAGGEMVGLPGSAEIASWLRGIIKTPKKRKKGLRLLY